MNDGVDELAGTGTSGPQLTTGPRLLKLGESIELRFSLPDGATHRDLAEMVRLGLFRRDLYHRLNVVTLQIPPLRERKEDLPLLVDRFLDQFGKEYGKPIRGVTRRAMNALLSHHWPGNVRELKNTIEGLVVFASSGARLDLDDLPEEVGGSPSTSPDLPIRVGMSLAEVERTMIEETLRSVGYDKPRAAQTLGIGLRTLYRKVKLYEIDC